MLMLETVYMIPKDFIKTANHFQVIYNVYNNDLLRTVFIFEVQ